ncbi:MAG: RnfH family protein [Burkholderiaceae bacterium]|nr:RnfH family protein [Burkholderiaceae bacterium]
MRVEVAWTNEEEGVVVREYELPEGATVDDALAAIGPPVGETLRAGVDETALAVAVYGQLRSRGTVLVEGDRVELVGRLLADPKAARRRRVQQRRAEGAEPRWKRR